MAKLDKALVYETRDYRFESCRVRHIRACRPPRGSRERPVGRPVREWAEPPFEENLKDTSAETTVGGDLVAQGLELLLAGMGVIFAFLGLLVGACTVLARAMRGWRAVPVPQREDDELVAAVTAAIRHHRRLRAPGGS